MLLARGEDAKLIRALHRAHYEASGDCSPYAVPPLIILGASPLFRRGRFNRKLSFTTGRTKETEHGFVLLPDDQSPLAELQQESGLPLVDSGIYMGKVKPMLEEKSFTIGSFSLAMLQALPDGSFLLLQ